MLLKRIECRVGEDEREAFDAAQRRWRPIRYVDGVIAQVGGHAVGDDERVVVLAVWRDTPSHERFMRDVHDAVATEIVSSTTALFDVVSRLPGQRIRLGESLGAGRLLRLASCRVRADAVAEFVRAQLDVWTPGMASAKGMLGGAFARSRDEADHFIVATAWESEELHQLYADHHFPELRRRAGLSEEAVTITAELIALDHHWTIIGVG